MKIALTKTDCGLISIAGLDEDGNPLMAVKIPMGKLKKMFPGAALVGILDAACTRSVLYPDWSEWENDLMAEVELEAETVDPDHTNESELD